MAQVQRRKQRRVRPVNTFVEGERLSLHRSTGMAYFSLPDESGRRRRYYQGRYLRDDGSPDPATLARAARWVRAYRAVGGPPPSDATTGLTVSQLVDRHQKYAEGYYGGADAGQCEHFATVGRFVVGLYGDVRAEEFGPLALRALRDKMVESGRWCRAGVNRNVQSVRRIFRWASSNELLSVAVFHALATVEGLHRGRTTAREGKRVQPVSQEHVTAVLPFLSRQVRAMVELQLLTGARPGEVAMLRPCDLNRTSDVWVYRPQKHKTAHHGHERLVYLGPKAQAVLTPFLLRPVEESCFSPAEAEEERLQTRHAARKTPEGHGNTRGTNRVAKPEKAPGDRYDVHAYRRCIARACARAEVPTWHPHQLRHTRATEIRAAFGLEAAQAVLGHADLRVTQVYAERDAEAARRVAAQLG
jgi:integrase